MKAKKVFILNPNFGKAKRKKPHKDDKKIDEEVEKENPTHEETSLDLRLF
jgi:hypothetical protein